MKTKHHLIVENHDNAKEMLKKALLGKNNIYWSDTLSELSDSYGEEEAVEIFMNQVAKITIRPGDEVVIISGNKTIPEEHIIVSILRKRFMETVVIKILTENIEEPVEIPYAERYSVRRDPRDIHYADSDFSPGGGCGSCSGSCDNC